VKRWRPTYSLLDVMRASAELPMPAGKSRHQLTRMHEGLLAIETAPNPKPDDWRVVADAVNLMETLAAMGWIVDGLGLIDDAVEALAVAGARAQDEGKPIRLQGRGIEAVRGVLEDYAEALGGLPERVIVDAHRRTEQRMHAILTGRPQAHDKLVVHA
jgi:uncharacterized protein YyaL (SSP411 family)